MCWTHIISQRIATQALDEAIELLPANKLLAFGWDYHIQIEKIYGHLAMAREDVRRALAGRVASRELAGAQALESARRWFCENPRGLYHSQV